MRVYKSLTQMQEAYRLKQQTAEYRKKHKYDGLEACRKNVVNCNVLNKVKYCIPRS